MVSDWLMTNMFQNEENKEEIVKHIIENIGSHATTLSHSRHLHIPDLKNMGLKIFELESDQELQDKVLSVHHATIISLSQTKSIKIIENNIDKAYIQIA